MADREEKHSNIGERDTSVVHQIEGISRIENEKDHQLSSIEGDPLHTISTTQARLCVKPTTLCVSPRDETLS
jgi:hypothetical protein